MQLFKEVLLVEQGKVYKQQKQQEDAATRIEHSLQAQLLAQGFQQAQAAAAQDLAAQQGLGQYQQHNGSSWSSTTTSYT